MIVPAGHYGTALDGDSRGLSDLAAAGTTDQPSPLQPGAQGYQEFDLDHLEDAPAPNFIAFEHNPDVPNPAAAAAAVINAWAIEDLSSDENMFAPAETATQFIKGHTVHGDVHAFSKAMTRYIQGGRMSSYDITRQVQAWAFSCKSFLLNRLIN